MATAWEAVSGKVVEVVAADIEQLCLGREASWNFGVATGLAGGMLGFNLGEGKKKDEEVAMVVVDWNHRALKALHIEPFIHSHHIHIGSCKLHV